MTQQKVATAKPTGERPTVAVLGTGIIGAPVARNLERAGYRVQAWNRSPAKAQVLATADGVTVCPTPAAAVSGAQAIITLLKDGPAVLEVMQAAAPALTRGALWLQMSTVGAAANATLAEFAAAHGQILYDSPVQGSRQPAEQGQLTVLLSGPMQRPELVDQICAAIAARVVIVSTRVGDSSRLKLVLNSWVLTLANGVAESLAIAQGLGVDPAAFIDVVSGGPLDSPFFQVKAKAVLTADDVTTFSISNALKDALLVIEAAASVGVPTAMNNASRIRFEQAVAAGRGERDMVASA